MKKIIKFMILIGILCTFFGFKTRVNAAIQYESERNFDFSGQGKGTEDNPFVITTIEQLYEIQNNMSAHYKLGKNLNMSQVEDWNPIGTENHPFTGVFDGGGHTISNLKIKKQSNFEDEYLFSVYYGLFGFVENATIENIGLENVDYDISYLDFSQSDAPFVYIGGIVGGMKLSTISNSYFSGEITGEVGKNILIRIGAIASTVVENSKIIDCYSDAEIIAEGYSHNTMVAGITAWLTDSIIDKCYAIGNIKGNNSTGVIYGAGLNGSGGSGTVSNSVSLLGNLEISGAYCIIDDIANYSMLSNNLVIKDDSIEAYEKDTYENLGWDFENVWDISEKYPVLRVFENTDYFTIGIDNNSFGHTANDFFYDEEEKKYLISDYFYNQLLDKASGINEKIIKDIKESEWNGACQGLCFAEALANNEKIADVTQGRDFFELSSPKETIREPDLRNTIHYYQLLQYIIKPDYITYSSFVENNIFGGLDKEDFLRKLVQKAQESEEKNIPIILTYMYDETMYLSKEEEKALKKSVDGYSGKGGHSVIICGYDYALNNEGNYEHQLKIYDLNKKTDFLYLYISDDFNSFDFQDSNMAVFTNILKEMFPESNKELRLEHIFTSMEIYGIECLDNAAKERKPYDNNEVEKNASMFSEMSEQYDNKAQIFISINDPFVLTNDKGEMLKYDGEKIGGDMKVYSSKMLGETDLSVILTVDSSESFVVSNINNEVKIAAEIHNQYYMANTIGAERILLNQVEGVVMNGKSYNFSSSIGTNQNSCDMIKISGKTCGKSVLGIQNNKVCFTSESGCSDAVVGTYLGTKYSEQKVDDIFNKIEICDSTTGNIQIDTTFIEKNVPGDKTEIPSIKPNMSQTTGTNKGASATLVKASSLHISGLSNKIAAGKKIQLAITFTPSNVSNQNVIWTSSNPKIATVDKNGVVTFKKKTGGKSVIITATATDGSGAKAVFKLKSMKGVVKKVSISGAKKRTVKAGKAIKLKAKVTATKGANKKLQWTSSNTKYATVSASGKVKTKKAGKGKTVKIIAMATDGSGKKQTVKVKMK